jgi:hypothetical protein
MALPRRRLGSLKQRGSVDPLQPRPAVPLCDLVTPTDRAVLAIVLPLGAQADAKGRQIPVGDLTRDLDRLTARPDHERLVKDLQ